MRVNEYEVNRATKQRKLIRSWAVSYARKHGRPRGRGKRHLKVRLITGA